MPEYDTYRMIESPEKPKIAIFCKTFLKGGAEKQALILTRLLAENGYDVSVIGWHGDRIDPGNLKYVSDNTLRYVPLSGNMLRKFLGFLRYLKTENISFILSYLTLSNFVAGLSRRLIPGITVVGGMRNEKLPYYKFLFERWIHNHMSSASVFNNYSGRDKFTARGFDVRKSFVIHNAIGNLKPKRSVSAREELRIVSVARFVNQKDYPTALRAFSLFCEKNSDINVIYHIIGYGPLESDIRSLARKLGIEGRVRFNINPGNIDELLTGCDIFLSTSLFEGLSNSIMEAMAASLPVIATKVGDNGYLVRDGYNGYLVPCGDVAMIAGKLEYLVSNKDIRTKMGTNSFELLENEFSEKKLVENYLKLLFVNLPC